MLIYVSHPYAGLEENKRKIEEVCLKLIKQYPNDVIVSPVHAFGYAYNAVPYEQGLNMCMELLSKCDKMLVYGDWKASRGCTAEVLYAGFNFIPFEIVEE